MAAILPLLLNPYHDPELAAFLVPFNRGKKLQQIKIEEYATKRKRLVLVWSSLMIQRLTFQV